MRNIVVCCDGTWNTPTQKDRGRVVPSNVVKMARAAKVDPELLYYDAGIGTGRLADRLTGGAFGMGLTENILQAYRYIADTYRDDDDRLFLFGFSRGAYTVRSLAGLIGFCGLPEAGDEAAITQAYELYRGRREPEHIAQAAAFKAAQRPAAIWFLGVWDTVGALGVPALSRYGLVRKLVKKVTRGSKWAHGFHDERLGEDVVHAYQALAIDERRGPFAPSVWKHEPGAPERANAAQVWFPGAHTNVGGGNVDPGLSDHAFMWMAARAHSAGLELDDLYLAIRVDPNWHGELRDSMSAFYRTLPRKVRALGATDTLNEAIHRSAQGRYEHRTDGYRPENLARGLATSPSIDDVGIKETAEIRLGRAGLPAR